MSLTSKKLTAVLPCYKEEHIIPVMYQRLTDVLKRVTSDYEIIWINDASPDNSLEVLEKLADSDQHVKVISFSRNFGIHRAFSCGLDYASGDGVVLLDGDLQDPPELIEEFVKKWNEGYDVVYGHRTKRKETLSRRIAFKLFYRVFAGLSYIKIPRDVGEFALLDRKVVEAMKLFGERDRFMRGLRAWVGFKQTGVPYVRDARYSGQSTNNLRKNIKWAKLAIFSFSYAPMEFISWLALATVGLSGLGILFYFLAYFFSREIPGFATIILTILFFSGVQLLCISFLAEYIGRIFEESKARPLYLIGRTKNIEVTGYSRPPHTVN